MLVAGYVRHIEIIYKMTSVPKPIIDIIYLFQQFCDLWSKTYTHHGISINDMANTIIVTAGDDTFKSRTAYGSNVIEDGIHKWKIKILSIRYDFSFAGVPFIGIIKDDEQYLKKYVDRGTWECDGYLFCGGNGEFCGMNDPDDVKYEDLLMGLKWKRPNDILEIVLDLNQRTLQFSVNGEDPMIVWGKDGDDCIEKGKYRLALTCSCMDAQFQLL